MFAEAAYQRQQEAGGGDGRRTANVARAKARGGSGTICAVMAIAVYARYKWQNARL